MTQCVVAGCQEAAVALISKQTQWSVWEYQVCRRHKDEADGGAFVQDHPDGRTITLEQSDRAPEDRHAGPTSDIDLPLEGGRLTRSDAVDGPAGGGHQGMG